MGEACARTNSLESVAADFAVRGVVSCPGFLETLSSIRIGQRDGLVLQLLDEEGFSRRRHLLQLLEEGVLASETRATILLLARKLIERDLWLIGFAGVSFEDGTWLF